MHQLSISIPDAGIVRSLTTNGVRLLRYVPIQGSLAEYEEGKPVTESIEILIRGATRSETDGIKSEIQRLLWLAANRRTMKTGSRIYLEWQPMNEAQTYRSEILDGAFLPDDNTIQAWGNHVIPGRIVLERVPYREREEIEIPISSATQVVAATGGRTITIGSNNYLNIAANVIAGDVPSPVRLVLTNNSGANLTPRNFYFGMNTAPSYGDATIVATSLVGAANMLDLWQLVETFTLSAASLQAMEGRRFRLFAVTTATNANQWLRARILSANIDVWSPSVSVQNTTRLLDFGTTPLPPGGLAATNAELQIFFQGFGTGTVDLERMIILPTDFFSKVTQIGGTLLDTQSIVIDWETGHAWVNLATYRQFLLDKPVGVLRVMPGIAQRMVIIADLQNGTFPTNTTFSVRAYYRPRRLSV